MTQVTMAIQEAERLILKNGGEISPASEITYNGGYDVVLEAIDFLVDNCDYTFKK